jgi:hypothetical protein
MNEPQCAIPYRFHERRYYFQFFLLTKWCRTRSQKTGGTGAPFGWQVRGSYEEGCGWVGGLMGGEVVERGVYS